MHFHTNSIRFSPSYQYCSSDSGNIHNRNNNNKHNLQHAQQQKPHYHEKEPTLIRDTLHDGIEVGQRTRNSEEHEDEEVGNVGDEDVVNAINNANDDNSSSEQQPDIIPYPLSVGETSWKAEKLRRQQQQQQQKQKQQQERWKRT